MVGKIKHVRQKIHQEAVKLKPSSLTRSPLLCQNLERTALGAPPEQNGKSDASKTVQKALEKGSFLTGIFAGTEITSEALVQTLKFEEPPDVPSPGHNAE